MAHILLHCDHPDIKGKKLTFLTKYANCTNAVKSSSDKMRETLNLDPSCNADLLEIFAIVSHAYIALNLLSD